MGLRPSVNNEKVGSTNDKPRPRMIDNVNNDETEQKSRINSGSVEMFRNRDEIKSNNDMQQLQQPKQEAWTARGKLLLNFHDAISRAINSPEMMRKCSQIAKVMSESPGQACESTSSTSSSKAQDYQAEASLIIDNKSKRDAEVRNKSIAVGLLSFATLRFCRSGIPYIRNAITWQMNVGGVYRFDKMTGAHHNLQKLSSQMDKKSSKQPGRLRQSLNLAFDFTISSCLALFSYTHLFCPRPSAYIQDMAQLPLVEGKSLYAEMVCPSLMKEYSRVLERYGKWPVKVSVDEELNKQQQHSQQQQQPTQEDVSLNIIRKFVENCTKRSKYERALLEERNAFNDALTSHRDDEDRFGAKLMKRFTKGNIEEVRSENNDEGYKLGTVPVPSPGVPEDIFVDIDHELHFLNGAGNEKVMAVMVEEDH